MSLGYRLCFLFVFETGSQFVVQAGLELTVLLNAGMISMCHRTRSRGHISPQTTLPTLQLQTKGEKTAAVNVRASCLSHRSWDCPAQTLSELLLPDGFRAPRALPDSSAHPDSPCALRAKGSHDISAPFRTYMRSRTVRAGVTGARDKARVELDSPSPS